MRLVLVIRGHLVASRRRQPLLLDTGTEYRQDGMLLPKSTTADGVRCNTIIKRYPGGVARVMVAERALFRIPGYEAQRAEATTLAAQAQPEQPGGVIAEARIAEDTRKGLCYDGGPTPEEQARMAANRERAQRRARVAVRDLALSNPFRYFVTLTFDRQRVNRWDDKEVLRVTMNWLDNHVRRDGLAYVLVPERHKDGAIHFHGFFTDAIEGVDSGHRTRRGQVIYNLPAWPWGFTTAIDIYGDYGAAVGYVCKYVTKGQEKVGGRWYYHGGSLRRPDVEYLNTPWEDVSQDWDTSTIEALGCALAFCETDAERGCEK